MPEFSILTILQLVVGLGLLNVWLLRAGSPTGYRGGEAQSLKEEFAAYGLPDIAFYLVGGLKVAAGVVLVAGIWFALPVQLAAGVVAVLMVGALTMHAKVGDPAKRSLPAALMLLMSIAIVLLV
jgi:hypothetical protein